MNNYKTRLEEMKYLRFEKNWSIEKIAEKFYISRQRVHQLLGNTKRKKSNKPDVIKTNLSLIVSQDVPEGFAEVKRIDSPCPEAVNKSRSVAYYCNNAECCGWIIGVPNIYKVNHIREFYCLRCGKLLGTVK